MSMKGISSSSAEPDKLSRRISLTHKRNSCELDVFEAAVYLSGYNETSSGDHRNTQKYGYNEAREENRRRWGILGGGERRISLDLPIRCSEQVHHIYQDHHEVSTIKERLGNVRNKQPSSPGGKIASFLSSLFHQARSKKNKLKSKSKPSETEAEEEVTGVGWMRRRRRSSISHFLSSSRSNTTTTTTSSSSAKSLILSSNSGFRTPPPYINTPTKNFKQLLNYTSATKQVGEEEKKTKKEFSWLDEKVKMMESLSGNQRVWADEDKRIKREEEEEDGMESDSSSDLFELQNYELSRGGLPVYETTNVANINNTHK